MGFLIRKTALREGLKVLTYTNVSPRIGKLLIKVGTQLVTLFSVYAPTEVAAMRRPPSVRIFHSTLTNEVSKVPASTHLIVLGDFNAHILPEYGDERNGGRSFHVGPYGIHTMYPTFCIRERYGDCQYFLPHASSDGSLLWHIPHQ